MKIGTYLGILLLIFGCSANNKSDQYKITDPNATNETKLLYANLMEVSKEKVLYGHQDDLAYGIGWKNIPGKSDVKDVSGSFPAVFGWDLGGIGTSHNLDSVEFSKMKTWMEEAYNLGGINTVSWHMLNPVTKTNSWDTTQAVAACLPGGAEHTYFKTQLQHAGNFFKSLKGANGELVPIIFRPWHEHTGSWFWWGKDNCTEQEYKDLWKFTVHYLRDSLQVNNLLYAYSPDAYREYMYGYPGDEYVDVFGMDMYFFGEETTEFANILDEKLQNLVQLAETHKKLPALTETGREKLIPINWHTEVLLKALKMNQNKKIAYVLTWRNARLDHFYAPYPGHESAQDFISFKNDSMILFLDELPPMYK